jgi:transcriptional regulator with XRE-family HTH domain
MALESPTLTQKRLAERMGCEPGTVSKLLNDGMKINLGWLANFAAALNKSVPELFIDPRAPTRDELLAAGTPEELRQAIELVRMAKRGTRS